jgi:uncharacterized protein (DUF2237 family)
MHGRYNRSGNGTSTGNSTSTGTGTRAITGTGTGHRWYVIGASWRNNTWGALIQLDCGHRAMLVTDTRS